MNLLNHTDLTWRQYDEGDAFGYPINYSDAILSASEDGRLEVLVKWEPNCFCHFHRHTAEISSVVLQGQLTVTDIDPESGEPIGSRIREVGDFVHKPSGDVHMEQGGPEGALVLFFIYAPDGDGVLAEALDADRNVISRTSMKKIRAKRL
jgi:quercetin dioxygenase-like cupin family protein